MALTKENKEYLLEQFEIFLKEDLLDNFFLYLSEQTTLKKFPINLVEPAKKIEYEYKKVPLFDNEKLERMKKKKPQIALYFSDTINELLEHLNIQLNLVNMSNQPIFFKISSNSSSKQVPNALFFTYEKTSLTLENLSDPNYYQKNYHSQSHKAHLKALFSSMMIGVKTPYSEIFLDDKFKETVDTKRHSFNNQLLSIINNLNECSDDINLIDRVLSNSKYSLYSLEDFSKKIQSGFSLAINSVFSNSVFRSNKFAFNFINSYLQETHSMIRQVEQTDNMLSLTHKHLIRNLPLNTLIKSNNISLLTSLVQLNHIKDNPQHFYKEILSQNDDLSLLKIWNNHFELYSKNYHNQIFKSVLDELSLTFSNYFSQKPPSEVDSLLSTLKKDPQKFIKQQITAQSFFHNKDYDIGIVDHYQYYGFDISREKFVTPLNLQNSWSEIKNLLTELQNDKFKVIHDNDSKNISFLLKTNVPLRYSSQEFLDTIVDFIQIHFKHNLKFEERNGEKVNVFEEKKALFSATIRDLTLKMQLQEDNPKNRNSSIKKI